MPRPDHAIALAVFLFLTGSLVAWVWVLRRLGRGQSLLPPPQPRVAPWGLNGVGAVVLLWLLVASPPAARANPHQDEHLIAKFIALALVNAALLVLVPLLLSAMARARLADLGLTRHELGWNLLRGAVACLLLSPPVYAINWLALQYWPVHKHPLETMVLENPTAPVALLAVVSGVILAPAAEELLFRGVLLGWLNRLWSREKRPDPALESAFSEPISGENLGLPAKAAERFRPSTVLPNLITSLIFAGIHWAQWPAPLALLPLSLGLGMLYQRTGSLAAPITLHALFNGLSTFALFLAIH